MAQLYDPDKMPEGLKEAHRLNDEAVERCYRIKPFNSGEERLEYLFKLYEKMIQKEKEKGTLFETKELTVFENSEIRRHYDSENEIWYFSLVDIVGALTDSTNPTDYLKKMRKRDPELNAYIGTNCPQVAMLTNGKNRKTLAGNV